MTGPCRKPGDAAATWPALPGCHSVQNNAKETRKRSQALRLSSVMKSGAFWGNIKYHTLLKARLPWRAQGPGSQAAGWSLALTPPTPTTPRPRLPGAWAGPPDPRAGSGAGAGSDHRGPRLQDPLYPKGSDLGAGAGARGRARSQEVQFVGCGRGGAGSQGGQTAGRGWGQVLGWLPGARLGLVPGAGSSFAPSGVGTAPRGRG